MNERNIKFARYSTLFFSVLAFVVVAGTGLTRTVPALAIYLLVGCAGVFVAAGTRLYAGIALVLAISWNALSWTERFLWDDKVIFMAEFFFAMGFFTFLTFLVLRHLFMARTVSGDLLFGAGAAYLMLGLFFAFIYQVAVLVSPGCIIFPSGEGGSSVLIYYSFTTLTTLGYGDIIPAAPSMRTTAILEATLGVFFSAILIGRLMGLYLTGMNRTER